MRTIVAGSRTIEQYSKVADAINSAPWIVSSIISGGAKGVDSMGEAYAYLHKLPLEIFNAEWEKHGKSAGPRRNEVMAQNADALVAIWDGISKGTAHMIETAKKHNLKIHVKIA